MSWKLCAISLAIGTCLQVTSPTAGPAAAQPAKEWTFVGQVAPRQTVEVANQTNGVVKQIHVVPGQQVRRGDLLVSLDDADARIEVTIAEAALEESRARLELANDVARRQQQLTARGTGAEARAVQRTLQAAIAKASVNQAGARLAAARLSLARTKIRAPIDGTVGRLRVARGAFVEAEGGTVVLELVQLDPVLVSYAVPYEARQQAMINAGTRNVSELLKRLRLSIRLPGGKIYPSSGNSLFESARIEPGTKTLRVWGEFPNADRILVPGLEVGVISRLAGNAKPGAE